MKTDQGMFEVHPAFCSNASTNRHWLIPAKKGLVCEGVTRYNQHDRLVRNKGLTAGKETKPVSSIARGGA